MNWQKEKIRFETKWVIWESTREVTDVYMFMNQRIAMMFCELLNRQPDFYRRHARHYHDILHSVQYVGDRPEHVHELRMRLKWLRNNK